MFELEVAKLLMEYKVGFALNTYNPPQIEIKMKSYILTLERGEGDNIIVTEKYAGINSWTMKESHLIEELTDYLDYINNPYWVPFSEFFDVRRLSMKDIKDMMKDALENKSELTFKIQDGELIIEDEKTDYRAILEE